MIIIIIASFIITSKTNSAHAGRLMTFVSCNELFFLLNAVRELIVALGPNYILRHSTE
jgi:hypothetical protein